jgi:uncharacterized membrane protein
MLIPFPITFLVGALATDLAFVGTGDTFWARASFWLVTAGLAIGLIAAVFGAIDFVTIRRVREHLGGWIHMMGNVIVVLLAVLSVLLRGDDPVAAVIPWGLVLSVLVTALLAAVPAGDGELVYRHEVAVAGPAEGEERPPRLM